MNLSDVKPRSVDQPGDRVRINTEYPETSAHGAVGTSEGWEHSYIVLITDEPINQATRFLMRPEELDPA